jgi:hypothetical protein
LQVKRNLYNTRICTTNHSRYAVFTLFLNTLARYCAEINGHNADFTGFGDVSCWESMQGILTPGQIGTLVKYQMGIYPPLETWETEFFLNSMLHYSKVILHALHCFLHTDLQMFSL